jgi:hypothetical protein
MDLSETLQRRVSEVSNERIAQLDEKSIGISEMDVRVRAVQITQRSLESMWLLLEHDPLMARSAPSTPLDGDAELERHVEAWHSGDRTGRLDAGEIVERVLAALDEIRDPVQPPAGSG